MATCRSCGRPVVWSQTEAGKYIPLDPEPVYDGNVVLEAHGALARVVAPRRDVKRHISHFVTCPNAGQHRRRS